MRRAILTIATALFALTSFAQLRTSYFMEGTYFRTDMNPALTPDKGYFTLPVIGGMGTSINNNFLSVDNFVYKVGSETVTALDSRVPTADFIKKLPKTGFFNFNSQISLLSVGFNARKMFWDFGVNVKMSADVSMDKSLLYALKSIGNGTYNLSAVGFDTNVYTELYVGAARNVNDWLRVGAKVKGLVGIENTHGQLSDSYISVTRSQIDASIYGTMRGSGAVINPSFTLDEEMDFGDMIITDPSQINVKSGGVAIDLGAEVRFFDEHLRVSVGVTDLGFICWSATNAVAETFNADVVYRGFNFDTGEVDMAAETSFVSNDPSGYTRRLNTTLNIGAEYNILNNHIAFGLLSHTEFRPLYTSSELTASVNFRLGKSFTTTFSQTLFSRNRPGVLGFALNIHPKGYNLLLGVDYVDTSYVLAGDYIAPKYQKSLNFYFGMGFNLRGKKR